MQHSGEDREDAVKRDCQSAGGKVMATDAASHRRKEVLQSQLPLTVSGSHGWIPPSPWLASSDQTRTCSPVHSCRRNCFGWDNHTIQYYPVVASSSPHRCCRLACSKKRGSSCSERQLTPSVILYHRSRAYRVEWDQDGQWPVLHQLTVRSELATQSEIFPADTAVHSPCKYNGSKGRT